MIGWGRFFYSYVSPHSKMHKLSAYIDDREIAYSHPAQYQVETTSSGTRRLVVGVPGGDHLVMLKLLGTLPGPFSALYILHTSRGEGPLGRYQSPTLSHQELATLLNDFGQFLGHDARSDFWVHCFETEATIVWDRHNLIFAYGPLTDYEQALRELGFTSGTPAIPAPHAHHYHSGYDAAAKSLLTAYDWRHSSLRPEDEQ